MTTIPIDPLRPGTAAPHGAPVARSGAAGADFAATLGAVTRSSQAPSASADVEATPPGGVQADMVAASRTWESLQSTGRELRFDADGGGHVNVTMHHVSGERIAILDLHDVYALIEHERRN